MTEKMGGGEVGGDARTRVARNLTPPPQGVFATFPKNEKKLIDICDTLGVPNHHLDTKPNAASPRHHLAVS